MEQVEITLANDAPGIGKAGQKVVLDLKPADVHDPREMSTLVAGYKNFQFRADEASPPILVDKDQDKYRVFSSDDAFQPVSVKGSLTGAVPEVDPRSSLSPYKVVDRFVGSFIPRETERQADTFSPRAKAGRRCRTAIDLDREIDVFSTYGTSTTFAAAQRLALTATQNWNGGADSDPILALQTLMENSLQMVTDFWLNDKVANAMIRHDKVKDHMRQFLGDNAPAQALSNVARAVSSDVSVDFAIPGFPPFHVVASRKKTSSGVVRCLGDVVVGTTLLDRVPTDGEEIATSYSFRRRGLSGTGFESREFEVQNRGPLGGTMVVVSMADVQVITANDAGGIITGVLT